MLWLLKLRTMLGWGRHPIELRYAASVRLREFALVLLLVLFVVLFSAAAFLVTATSEHHAQLTLQLTASSLRVGSFVGAYCLLLAVAFLLVPALSFQWLARRAARNHMRMASVYGHCFAVLLDPPRAFYARIGQIESGAHWYLLPLGWDDFVTPSDTQIEMEVLPTTGWVQRTRVASNPAHVLTRPEPEIAPGGAAVAVPSPAAAPAHDQAAQPPEEDGATDEERRAMRRFARRQPLGWRAKPSSFRTCGWVFVTFGLIVGPGFLVLVAYLLAVYPANLTAPNSSLAALAIFLTCLLATGATLSGFGIRCLRVWRRLQPLTHQPPTVATGEVLCWIKYRDIWTSTNHQQPEETLIEMQQDDGETQIFRIPVRYLHRVRQRGARVRITYLPTTERVLEVTRFATPATPATLSPPTSTPS